MYVFDTSILVAAFRSRRGASFLILQALRQRVISGAVSEALFLEYSDVLKRDENLQQFWVVSDEVDVILGVLADVLTPVPIYFGSVNICYEILNKRKLVLLIENNNAKKPIFT